MSQNKLLLKSIFLIILALVVSSCSNNERRVELEAYVKKIKSREIKEIEPLPEVKPYETFAYSDTNLRSPFVPSAPVEVAKNMVNDNGIHPDPNRRKEPLEAFPLDSLRMMGTLEKNGKDGLLLRTLMELSIALQKEILLVSMMEKLKISRKKKSLLLKLFRMVQAVGVNVKHN